MHFFGLDTQRHVQQAFKSESMVKVSHLIISTGVLATVGVTITRVDCTLVELWTASSALTFLSMQGGAVQPMPGCEILCNASSARQLGQICGSPRFVRIGIVW